MADDGYTVPALPCALIEAKDCKDAAEKILLISSQYGRMTNNSLEDFLSANDLAFADLQDELELPSIDLEFFSDSDFQPSTAADQGRLDKKNSIQCPNAVMRSSPKPMLRLDWCSHDAAKYAVQHWHYSGRYPPPRPLG